MDTEEHERRGADGADENERRAQALREARQELSASSFEASAADGRVTVRVSGDGRLRAVELDPGLTARDARRIGPWVQQALRDARERAGGEAHRRLAPDQDLDQLMERARSAVPWLTFPGKSSRQQGGDS